jgi:hypothetical protein
MTAGIQSGMCQATADGTPLDQALRNVAEILSAWPGARKTLILISNHGADFSDMTLDTSLRLDNLGRTFAAMQRANLNVYQFDPRGLEVGRKSSEGFGSWPTTRAAVPSWIRTRPGKECRKYSVRTAPTISWDFGPPAGRTTAVSARSP